MRKYHFLYMGLGIAMLCAGVLASLALGSRMIPLQEVVRILFGDGGDGLATAVVLERIPRTVFGILAGASLGVSGALMQAITRNPIADPSILGINTGAALFVVFGMSFLQMSTLQSYIWMALLGAFVTAIFVYSVGSIGAGGMTPIKLALAGAATSAALSSLVSALLLPRVEVMNAFRFWQVGSIGGATWSAVTTVLPFLFVGLFIALIISPQLDLMSLGEELAKGLGVHPGIVRVLGTLSAVTLCGAVTAVAGPIGFVGLMIPHVLKILFGPQLKWVVPMSMVYGGAILLFADVIGRMLGSPSELESGIVTAFLGAPVLIYVAARAKGGLSRHGV